MRNLSTGLQNPVGSHPMLPPAPARLVAHPGVCGPAQKGIDDGEREGRWMTAGRQAPPTPSEHLPPTYRLVFSPDKPRQHCPFPEPPGRSTITATTGSTSIDGVLSSDQRQCSLLHPLSDLSDSNNDGRGTMITSHFPVKEPDPQKA